MRPHLRFALLSLVLAGCEATSGGGGSAGGGAGVKVAESGTKRGSAGGFSATLAQEIGAPEGSMGAAAPPSAQPAAGSASAAGSGSAAAGNASGAATAAAGSAAGTATTAAAGKPGAGAAAGASTAAAGAAPAQQGSAAAPVPAKKGSRVYVKPSADLAAIKFDLEPNWERDVGEAGTFSLVLKVPGSDDTRVFSVRYGYDDQSAPVDCDQYRKYLATKKLMVPTLNRQRSGACYIESATAFRYLVNYGGKRLTCQGSLHKDAASASLGDLRDKVLMQAKKICETLAL